MSKCRLVADIGGTNSRFGLTYDGTLARDAIRSFRNDEFTNFNEVAAAYLSETELTQVDEVVVAIGGPVSGEVGRLTNRDWHFKTSQLLSVFGASKAKLINDLTAFGYAVHALEETSLDRIIDVPAPSTDSNQALVIGVGTGFNVSPVIRSGTRVVCAVSEFGHVALPIDVNTRLAMHLGPLNGEFQSIEHVFSGRGYKRLKDMLCNDTVTQNALSEKAFQSFYAQLLAHLTRGLMLAFLPRDGIFFSGSVVRNLLSTSARQAFVDILGLPFTLDVDLSVPVASILDDTAALVGCARYPMQGSTFE